MKDLRRPAGAVAGVTVAILAGLGLSAANIAGASLFGAIVLFAIYGVAGAGLGILLSKSAFEGLSPARCYQGLIMLGAAVLGIPALYMAAMALDFGGLRRLFCYGPVGMTAPPEELWACNFDFAQTAKEFLEMAAILGAPMALAIPLFFFIRFIKRLLPAGPVQEKGDS